MTPPAQAAGRFGYACLLGLLLGVLYGFLRPLRPGKTWLADSLFSLGLIYSWIFLTFAICRGDIRPGYSAGLFLGAWAFDRTLGKGLGPVFRLFWRGISLFFGSIWYPVRKIFEKMGKIMKFFIASLKKWGTIKWNKRCHAQDASGGSPDEGQTIPFIREDRIPKKLRSDEDRYSGSSGVVCYRDPDPPGRH